MCDKAKNIIKTVLPWAEDALPKIGNLALPKNGMEKDSLALGFELVHQIEDMIFNNKKEKKIQEVQYLHLIQIAKHEQGNILQPLIYDDPENGSMDFQDYLWVMRRLKWIMPKLELIFNSSCDVYSQEVLDEIALKEEETISKAHNGMILEDYKDRMKWIEEAAKNYHRLMVNNADYMENELSTMASWVNEQDSFMDHRAVTKIH
jgi:hypothetical protein